MRRTISCLVVVISFSVGCQQRQPPSATSAPAAKAAPTSAAASSPPTQEEAAPADKGKPSADSPNIVALDAFRLTAPTNWTRKPLSSPFVLAEFALPHAAGDELDGRLTISTAGGGVDANINRWRGQFQPQPNSASQEQVDIAGVKATLVDLAGDFNDQRGPFAPGELRPNYRMIAAVLPVDGQLYFIKATGPAKTIAANAEAIRAFVKSMTPKK